MTNQETIRSLADVSGAIQREIDHWERMGAGMKSRKDMLAFACVIGATTALNDLRRAIGEGL